MSQMVGTGALSGTRLTSSTTISGTEHMNAQINIDLSRSNSIFGNSDTVTPESMSCKFFIRY